MAATSVLVDPARVDRAARAAPPACRRTPTSPSRSPNGSAAARDDVVVAPALAYGSAGEHAGFAGTLSIGQAALELVVVELVRSAGDFAAVVLVCGHGGNAEPLGRAVAHAATGRSARAGVDAAATTSTRMPAGPRPRCRSRSTRAGAARRRRAGRRRSRSPSSNRAAIVGRAGGLAQRRARRPVGRVRGRGQRAARRDGGAA